MLIYRRILKLLLVDLVDLDQQVDLELEHQKNNQDGNGGEGEKGKTGKVSEN